MAHTIYKISGIKVPSVTTILGRFKNSTGLIIWSNGLGLKGLKYHEQLKIAGDIGTSLHQLAELYVTEQHYEMPEEEVLASCFKKFISWWEEFSKEELEIVFTEKGMCCKEFNFGGTPDLLIKKNNEYILIDFKTSKAIYPDNIIQSSCYRHMIKEQEGIEINKFILARFPKEGDDFEIREFNKEQLDQAFEYFKTLRTAFDQDKEITKLIKEKKK